MRKRKNIKGHCTLHRSAPSMNVDSGLEHKSCICVKVTNRMYKNTPSMSCRIASSINVHSNLYRSAPSMNVTKTVYDNMYKNTPGMSCRNTALS